MPAHTRPYFQDGPDQPSSFGGGDMTPAVRGLMIALTVGLFVSLLAPRGTALSGFDLYGALGLTPGDAVGRLHLWQLLTYTFLPHGAGFFGLIAFLFNVFMLYMFGKEVERRYGTRKFLLLYFLAGVFGGLLYCALHYHAAIPAIGAGPGVLAIITVYTLFDPRRQILFFAVLPMQMWVATAFFLLYYVASYLGQPGASGVIPVLGGALFGFLFFRYQGRVSDALSAMEERAETRAATRKFEEQQAIESRVDTLLEKINREGITALSESEKRFLKGASQHYRDKHR